jgi:hypothetical protein
MTNTSLPKGAWTMYFPIPPPDPKRTGHVITQANDPAAATARIVHPAIACAYELTQNGASEAEVASELVNAGLDFQTASSVAANMRSSVDGYPTSSATSSSASRAAAGIAIFGGFLFVVGIGLLIGNRSGLFPTFPFAGFWVMGLGGLMMSAFGRSWK